MKSIHETRIAKAARAIAARLESQPEVVLKITSEKADSKIFRILSYLDHYIGKYYITYINQEVIIRR